MMPEHWRVKLLKEPYKYKARAYIYQCNELPASDKDGDCDPFIEVWSPNDKQENPCTNVIEDNTNPVFYEAVEFDYYTLSLDDENPPFLLNIKDRDQHIYGDSYDFVGRAVIPYCEASVEITPEDNLQPLWHSIKMGYDPNEPEMGKILVSFSIIEDEHDFLQPIEYLNLEPDSSKYNIEINILGLRDLQSVGILPVKKSFVKFNIKSLLHPSMASAVQNVQTHPQSSGPNPDISTVIKFK